MSAFARFLRPQPASRRAYSSFFSSKSGGGGRYFTSAKPSKVVVTGKGTAPKVEPSAEPAVDGAQAAGVSGGNGSPNTVVNAAEQATKAASQPSPSSSTTSTPSAPGSGSTTETVHTSNATSNAFQHRPPHPMVNARDFKLHQFFSLHRPLLLLARPHSILESANAASFIPDEAIKSEPHSAVPQWLLDEFPEATPDADAAAARQLSRALTMSHAGSAVAWEDTLRRLGLDVDKDADRVALQEKLDKEWQDVLMDSRRRKRKKKMKKHKLKKRRKATRASRLKIGK
ncbi:hypothetical protein DXG01_006167 [Tephrocybe rancida]|nr:hypothetical protein DXG01_006167 [Tephrocybe rancida]